MSGWLGIGLQLATAEYCSKAISAILVIVFRVRRRKKATDGRGTDFLTIFLSLPMEYCAASISPIWLYMQVSSKR
jgi:hypothetical protein